MMVKICGVTSQEDAAMCETLGADMLGFVHYPGKLRSLPLARISEMCASLGPGASKVLVCSPPDERTAMEMFERSSADILQLCSLGPEETMSLRQRGVNVMRMVKPERAEAVKFASAVDYLVYEGGDPGSGAVYDYSKIPMGTCRREIIAGGLTPDNVHEAISMRPYGVDVSSGVESAPGRKDPAKVASFIARCRQ
jgi:phosphoribosylanthranilate isomerase